MILLDLPQVPLTLTRARGEQSDVVSVTGYVDAFTIPALQPALLAAAGEAAHPKAGPLTLDLSCVRFIDRAGLEMLRRVRREVAGQDRALVLRLRPGSQPERVIRAGNVDALLILPEAG